MKNFFLALVTLILIALLGTAVYVYNNPNAINKITNNSKKDDNKQDNESINENNDVNNAEANIDDTSNESYSEAKPINEMTKDEYDRYLLTQNRSYLTEEQQERYDYLLNEKGSNPGENNEKIAEYNNQQPSKDSTSNSQNQKSSENTSNTPTPPSGLSDDEYAEWEKQSYPPQAHNNAAENNQKYAKEHGLIPEEDK